VEIIYNINDGDKIPSTFLILMRYKKMKNKILLFLLLTILLSISVFAYTDYSDIGENDYKSDTTSFWNSALDSDDVIQYSRPLIDPQFTPLVSDLDGDGIKEIIVADGTQIKVYQNLSLDVIDAIDVISDVWRTKIFDINGDGNEDIIFLTKTTYGVLTYNGTLTLADIQYYTPTSFNQIQDYLECFNNECFFLIKEGNPLKYTSFDINGNKTVRRTIDSNTGLSASRNPAINSMSYEDYDNDGDNEFIFVSGDLSNLNIFYMNESYGIEQKISISGTYGKPTSPIVYDFDGFASNGLETLLGIQTSSNEFKLYLYYASGSELDDYPELLNADGIIVSNPIRGNFFTDTGDVDFCVLGYQTTQEKLDLLCGSAQHSSFVDAYEFKVDTTWNVTTEDFNNLMIHTIEASSVLTDGNNLDEVLSPYGVLRLDYTNDYSPLEVGYSLVYEKDLNDENVAVIPVDYNDDDREEMIYLTSTNLKLLTDGYENLGISDLVILSNPCYQGTIKLNTTWSLTITPEDPEEDQVSIRTILYYGLSNEQDSGWGNNYTSGTSISASISPNETISSGTLRVMARDTENTIPLIVDLPFSVGVDGYVFGEVTCSATTTTDLEETEQAEAVEDFEDELTSALDGLPLVGGLLSGFLTIPVIALFLILASIVGVYNRHSNLALAMVVGGVFMIILTYAGIMPMFMLLTLLILLIAIVVISNIALRSGDY